MADVPTINYAIVKMGHGEHVDTWDVQANLNYDIIDGAIKDRQNENGVTSAQVVVAQTTADNALPKSGGTMTGDITLVGDPTHPLEPATKQYTDAALDLKSDKGLVDDINSYSGSDNFALADLGAVVQITTAATMTIVAQATTIWPNNSRFDVIRTGAGEVTIAGDTGVTINSVGGKKRLNAQYSGASLIRYDIDKWYLIGDIKV